MNRYIFLKKNIYFTMKNKIIQSTFLLLIGGFITKVLGLWIRILMNRTVGIDGVSLYTLILPTFTLFITLGQIGLPIALSRLVALRTKNNQSLYFSILPVLFLFNLFLSLFIFLMAPIIGAVFLRQESAVLAIRAIAFVIPFTSLSAVFRSYFFGKEKMVPHVLSNILENLIRLCLIFFLAPRLSSYSLDILVFFLVIMNVISEGCSCLFLFIFLPKRFHLNRLSIQKNDFKDVFSVAIPNLSSDLFSSITYFIEPIFVTNLFLLFDFSHDFILKNYGIIHGYIFPILFLPSFFTSSISQAILPSFTRYYSSYQYSNIKKLLLGISFLFFFFGIFYYFILSFFGKQLLLFFYHTTLGYPYLIFLAFFFPFYYIQAPFYVLLHSMGKTSYLLVLSILSFLIKMISLLLFLLFSFGIYAYLFSFVCVILFTDFFFFYKIYHDLSL